MKQQLLEPLQGLFTSSLIVTLDFANIPANTPEEANLASFFADAQKQGLDPTRPLIRQQFNDQLLEHSQRRYLVGQYFEDRTALLAGSSILGEGRTCHLGIDIFSKDLELVYAPCDGTVVRAGREPQDHSFGYYLILKPDDAALPFMFFGHLGPDEQASGHVKAGQAMGRLGEHDAHVNGGWSRHLHLQFLRQLPAKGASLVGYAHPGDQSAAVDYPNPMDYFDSWNVQ